VYSNTVVHNEILFIESTTLTIEFNINSGELLLKQTYLTSKHQNTLLVITLFFFQICITITDS